MLKQQDSVKIGDDIITTEPSFFYDEGVRGTVLKINDVGYPVIDIEGRKMALFDGTYKIVK